MEDQKVRGREGRKVKRRGGSEKFGVRVTCHFSNRHLSSAFLPGLPVFPERVTDETQKGAEGAGYGRISP